jgi:hypothetical protein
MEKHFRIDRQKSKVSKPRGKEKTKDQTTRSTYDLFS